MTLALGPLRAALLLVEPFGDVVDEDVAGDVTGRVLARDVAAGRADHDAELHLPVAVARIPRQHDGIVRPGEAGQRLHEHDGLGRDGEVRFDRVVAIVEADRDDLADPGDGHAEARTARDERQRRDIDRGHRGERVRRDVGDERGEVADASGPVDEPGLLGAARAITAELHAGSLSRA